MNMVLNILQQSYSKISRRLSTLKAFTLCLEKRDRREEKRNEGKSNISIVLLARKKRNKEEIGIT